MIGKGEAGIVEGSDKIIVTVTELPVILVSAGESISVEGGTEAEFRGSFNRPAGVTNLRYSWSFGDGTAPEEGDIGDKNIIEASHNYVTFDNSHTLRRSPSRVTARPVLWRRLVR